MRKIRNIRLQRSIIWLKANDKLEAFRDARSKQVSKKHLLRNLLLDYVAKCEKEGRVIQAETENRIIVR